MDGGSDEGRMGQKELSSPEQCFWVPQSAMPREASFLAYLSIWAGSLARGSEKVSERSEDRARLGCHRGSEGRPAHP
eukprot:1713529-Prymnesium_polylepis.1